MPSSSDHYRVLKSGKICFVAAVELTIRVFIVDHLRKLSKKYRITVVVNTDNVDFLKPYGVDAKVVPVRIERRPAPFSDMAVLFKLYKLFKVEGFCVVHSITPKAGLLTMLAARMTCVPVRIHTFTGQIWATKRGLARWFFKSMDRVLESCATHILVDSYSQREFLISEGVISTDKSRVIADGSICGVDEKRFSSNPIARQATRNKLAIPANDIVFLFLGRLNRDKGLLDLAHAFSRIGKRFHNIHLVIVGPDEENIKGEILEICHLCSHMVHFKDFADAPEIYMAAADVFCLPSYREGFGMVVVEAAFTGIPSIASRIYGVTDTIEDRVTGLLFSPGDTEDLGHKMTIFAENPELTRKMGNAARERAHRLYSNEKVCAAMLDFYNQVTVFV